MIKFKLLNDRIMMTDKEILQKTYHTSTDMIIVSGTLLEEIGNCHSDIDVFVISNALPFKDQVGDRNYINSYGKKVRSFYDYLNLNDQTLNIGFDVEYYTINEIDKIINKIDKYYVEAKKNTKIFRKSLSEDEEDLVHKLLIGKAIKCKNKFLKIIEKINKKKFCFIKYRNSTGGYPEFKDVIGAYKSNDLDLSLYMLHEYLVDQINGLMYLNGETNTKKKWLVKRLKRAGREFPIIVEEYFRIIYTKKEKKEEKLKAIKKMMKLIDKINIEASKILNSEKLFYSTQEALYLTDKEYKRETFHDRQTDTEFVHRRSIFTVAHESTEKFVYQ